MLLPEPDDDTLTSLPIAPLEHLDPGDPLARLEQLLSERHANLVDVVSARLDRTERIVLALHREITDHGVRAEQVADLRADLTALERRVAALEARPACALMAAPGG
jgi:hypothetical protein